MSRESERTRPGSPQYFVVCLTCPHDPGSHRYGVTDSPDPRGGIVISVGLSYENAVKMKGEFNERAKGCGRLWDGSFR